MIESEFLQKLSETPRDWTNYRRIAAIQVGRRSQKMHVSHHRDLRWKSF
jgi:hypothetical protein